jgi:hypothetical protein
MYTIHAYINILETCFHKQRFSRYKTIIGFIFPYVAWMVLTPCASAQFHGTVIVILATPDTIIAAADSRITVANADGKDSIITPVLSSLTACKILKADETTFLAIQGFRTVGGVDILKEARDAMRRESGPLRVRFANAMKNMWHYSIHEEDLRRLHIGNTNYPLALVQIACFGIDSGSLVAMRWSVAEDSIRGPSIAKISTGNIVRGIMGAVHPNLDHFIITHPESIAGKPLITQAKILMEEALNLSPIECGAPVDILCITRTGYEWIQRKEQCTEFDK